MAIRLTAAARKPAFGRHLPTIPSPTPFAEETKRRFNFEGAVGRSDFRGAFAMLDDFNVPRVSVYHDEAFLLLEKGILKRLLGDLLRTLKDLTAASEILEDYYCSKRLGYVKYLMGDENGTLALKLLSRTNDLRCEARVGDETTIYMQFRLKGSEDIEKEPEDSAHSQVMEKVQTSGYSEALAIWDAFDTTVLGFYNRLLFFQERGIVKRLAGDHHGALPDLTKSLVIDPDDRGYVKFLLRDMDGARMGAERCLAMGLKEASDNCLGTQAVAFLEFNL